MFGVPRGYPHETNVSINRDVKPGNVNKILPTDCGVWARFFLDFWLAIGSTNRNRAISAPDPEWETSSDPLALTWRPERLHFSLAAHHVPFGAAPPRTLFLENVGWGTS